MSASSSTNPAWPLGQIMDGARTSLPAEQQPAGGVGNHQRLSDSKVSSAAWREPAPRNRNRSRREVAAAVDQQRPPRPSTGWGFLVRKPQC